MGDIWWIYANQTFLKHKWIYFLLKVQKTKIRANSSPQSCGRWAHSARNITYECLLRQPLSVLTSFKWSQWWCVKNLFHALWWRKNISFKKDTENNLLVGPKKSSPVSRNRPGENFTHPQSQMSIRIYIFN